MDWLHHPLYADLPPIFWGIFVFLGAAIGSFYNVLALRWGDVHRTESIQSTVAATSISPGSPGVVLPLMAGRSHCPKCSSQIPIYHNIPLVSWLLLRGKSACCSTPISPIYLLFEALGAGIFFLVALSVGPTVYGLVLGIILMTLALSLRLFLRESILPTGLIIAMQVLAVLLALGPGIVAPKAALTAQVALLGLSYGLGHLVRSKRPEIGFKPHDAILLGILGLIAGTQAHLALIGWIFAGLIGVVLPKRAKLATSSLLGVSNSNLFSFTALTLTTMVTSLVILNATGIFQ
ncbi:prepilin peptidase [Pseudomonas amygdali]|uniref:Prepilin peptidase n=1 Tax=Pseudomonas amygdali pv. lachrymans str. M301315 TaxID=629260 RepID=A0AAD0PX68_PSEAV|nr:A24 family peptidase [Pseudomonas amygdali]AXH60378.1 prepilin peptidase [Pseudomonas amygdali pv. lachrymans str. M301315]